MNNPIFHPSRLSRLLASFREDPVWWLLGLVILCQSAQGCVEAWAHRVCP